MLYIIGEGCDSVLLSSFDFLTQKGKGMLPPEYSKCITDRVPRQKLRKWKISLIKKTNYCHPLLRMGKLQHMTFLFGATQG